jgi:hypothetical protein
MSKGSRPRPFSVTQAEYDNRWDAIFQRDIKEEVQEKKELNEEINTEIKDSEQGG